MVTDFTISVHGSSCNLLVFKASFWLLCYSLSMYPQGRMGCQELDGENKRENEIKKR